MREFAPPPNKMGDASKEEFGREEQRLREAGIEHEVRLSNGRSAESKKSTETKKKKRIPEDSITHPVERESKEARKGSRGKDKSEPP